MYILESQRLAFRLMEQEDTDALYDVWGDAGTMRFCGGTVTKRRIKDIIAYDKDGFDKHGNAVFAVIDKNSGMLAGICGGKLDEDDPLHVEVIIHLNKTSQGRGFGTEAVSAYIAWLKQTHKATFVYGSVHPDNSASLNMMKKCGFIQNGFRQYEDTGFVDEPYFEMRL